MIKYEVIYSKRKSVALIVKEDETVTVRAPYGLPKKRIEELQAFSNSTKLALYDLHV